MQNIIGVKELYKNLNKVAAKVKKGESFLVMKHAEPIFRIEPAQPVHHGKFLLEKLKKIQFKSSDPHLSRNIDKILYGGKI